MMRGQKGITLVALVITIIVMLILVGVTITFALNGGLFGQAKNAVKDTKTALNAENTLDSGVVEFNGLGNNTPQTYVNNLLQQP